MRGSSSRDLIVRRMRALPGTVAMTHASMGTGNSGISNRRHTNAKPRGCPSCRSISIAGVPAGRLDDLLNVRKTTMPAQTRMQGVRNGSFVSILSDRTVRRVCRVELFLQLRADALRDLRHGLGLAIAAAAASSGTRMGQRGGRPARSVTLHPDRQGG
jgi:hypothetical protein